MRFTDNNAITAANMVDADILAGTDVSTGEDKKFPVGNLADYMLANRTQPVGGANQSITSAINAANSKADANTSAIGALETAVANKADADGEYDNLIVGTSKQLLSDSYTENFEPYKFRRSPYTDRLSESIVGASVVWNQFIRRVNVVDAVYGITRTKITGDKLGVHYSGTSTNSTNFAVAGFDAVSGHKYFFTLGATLPTGCRINVSTTDKTSEAIYSAPNTATVSFGMVITNGTTVDLDTYPQAFDLTVMFGSTVADALYNMGDEGVNLFRSWYPNDYYPFSNPTLEHVSGLEAHEMVGFNQFDKDNPSQIINGHFDSTNMVIIGGGSHAIYYVPCLPNTEYCATRKAVLTNERFAIADLDVVPQVGAPINHYSGAPTSQVVGNDMMVTLTTGPNAKYLAIWVYWGNAIDALNTLCVNISDPTRNGQYKPYESHSYALDASLTLRGILKYDATKGIYADGDTYKADGTVERRYGIVDLGTLAWTYLSESSRFYAVLTSMARPGSLMCTAYPQSFASNVQGMPDKTIWNQGYAYNTKNIVVYDTAYTSGASFKAAMSGVYLVYELATPTTEEADPYDAIQITDGTEEYVTDCLVPVGHESKYYENLRSKIEGLPTDFSAIICATEATNKASKNYAVGDYLIYNNTLYKVTTAIAANATLTVGTNITATTIMAEIKALQ